MEPRFNSGSPGCENAWFRTCNPRATARTQRNHAPSAGLLPGTDGMELMQSIVRIADVPVIFLSAYGRCSASTTSAGKVNCRCSGVDLTRIDGIEGFTALKVISEIGTDMTKWATAKCFASWLGLSPDNRITGGKVMSSRTKPSANRAAAALRLAAHGLHRSDSALGAFLRRKKADLGAPRAITATAHKLARLIYSMLRYGQDHVDAGAEYYESQYQQRALRAAKQRASQLGYQLVPMSDAPGVPPNTAAVH